MSIGSHSDLPESAHLLNRNWENTGRLEQSGVVDFQKKDMQKTNTMQAGFKQEMHRAKKPVLEISQFGYYS